MKTFLLIALAALTGTLVHAQDRYWVFFEDKGPDVAAQLDCPEKFMSPAAIIKRWDKNLEINESDVPVYAGYLDRLRPHALRLLGSSKWLNAAVVEAPAACRNEIEALPFVTGTRAVQTLVDSRVTTPDDAPEATSMVRYLPLNSQFDYGEATRQNTMINVDRLHARGFTGRGVTIALFDAGYNAADTLNGFDSLWAQNRVLTWYDFVDNDTTVFRSDNHGMQVLSTIASNLPGELVGSAPHATFVLCRTEEARTETKQEEHNWVRAMEWVDSIGVDIIHSSLGYSTFDLDKGNYTYDDMDGNTAVITRAADMAAAKGILVTTSAGNEGNGPWKYITAPCDADSALCIGSVTRSGKRSSFSSLGPAADGAVKPDVMAMGSNSAVLSPRNYVSRASGTSFSGPIMAGFMACLRQAHPERTNMELIRATQLSGDRYSSPSAEYGYGVPDAALADSILRTQSDVFAFERDSGARPSETAGSDRPLLNRPEPIRFAENPRSTVRVDGNDLEIQTTSPIREIEIRRGQQRVWFNQKLVDVDEREASFDLKYLLDGTHYVYIKTDDYEENVRFER